MNKTPGQFGIDALSKGTGGGTCLVDPAGRMIWRSFPMGLVQLSQNGLDVSLIYHYFSASHVIMHDS